MFAPERDGHRLRPCQRIGRQGWQAHWRGKCLHINIYASLFIYVFVCVYISTHICIYINICMHIAHSI